MNCNKIYKIVWIFSIVFSAYQQIGLLQNATAKPRGLPHNELPYCFEISGALAVEVDAG
jgi:hypothetical protein